MQHRQVASHLEGLGIEGVGADRVGGVATQHGEHAVEGLADGGRPLRLAAARHHQRPRGAFGNGHRAQLDAWHVRALGAVDDDVMPAPGQSRGEVGRDRLRSARRRGHRKHRRSEHRDPHRRIVRL